MSVFLAGFFTAILVFCGVFGILCLLSRVWFSDFWQKDPEILYADWPQTIPPQKTAEDGLDALMACCVMGNDAYPSNLCPFREDSVEASHWIVGRLMARRGVVVEGSKPRQYYRDILSQPVACRG